MTAGFGLIYYFLRGHGRDEGSRRLRVEGGVATFVTDRLITLYPSSMIDDLGRRGAK
jgi:hypothetical protein